MKILRTEATAAKCGVAPSTIRKWRSDPRFGHMGFPTPVKLGSKAVGDIESEVDDFLAALAAKRDTS